MKNLIGLTQFKLKKLETIIKLTNETIAQKIIDVDQALDEDIDLKDDLLQIIKN